MAAASWEVLAPTTAASRRRSDWQFMPYADEAGRRLLVHALYLGAASGYQVGGPLHRFPCAA
eukprot:COSAG01_NODE_11237_length_1976_cov_1.098562_4_plen_61_part_01